MKKDFGCDNHIWIASKYAPTKDAQCIKCGLTSWNSLTFKQSEIILINDYRKNTFW